jgi:membrane-associated phospholipid phosphatase
VAVNCKWCDRAPDGRNTLNGFDSWGRRAFLWHHTGRAITASNITGFMLGPAVAYGLDWVAASRDGRKWNAPVDAILITQAMATASDITEAVKFTVGRERPFVHVLAPLAKAATPASADNNTSFPSGHATLAFALATSSAEIARLRGYTDAPWLLRAGLPLATLTAYFRVASDKHYLTDVLAGAGIGAAVGFGAPYFAHRKKTGGRIPAVRIVPTPGGELVSAQWVW